MFTGIVESVGVVEAVEARADLCRIAIEAPAIRDGVRIGDSVAVNGACLTVTAIAGDRFSFDIVRESMDRTSLAGLTPGARVNLERSLRADGRLDGHIVQGHVDATGVVERLEREGDDVRLFVGVPESFAPDLVPKGSVTIDGVSLTVCGVRDQGFDVVLIPHTLKETTLGERRPGDPVNLEADILGKYVRRHLERLIPQKPA